MPPIVVTPPAVEPVSVVEFRRDRRLDPLPADDTSSAEYRDCLRTIAAARGHVEQYTRRALVERTLRIEVSGARYVPSPIALHYLPILAVEEVRVDGVVADPASYAVDLGLGTVQPWDWWDAPAGAWSFVARSVRVTYRAGYGAPDQVPDDLRQAVLRIAGDLWEHREDAIVGTVAARVTHDARALMDLYRVPLL